jgi:hypothetical protein
MIHAQIMSANDKLVLIGAGCHRQDTGSSPLMSPAIKLSLSASGSISDADNVLHPQFATKTPQILHPRLQFRKLGYRRSATALVGAMVSPSPISSATASAMSARHPDEV